MTTDEPDELGGIAFNDDPTDSDPRRVAVEALGDCDAFITSEGGPDGPWYHGMIVIRRQHNTILLHESDGTFYERIRVGNLPNGDAAIDELERRIRQFNEEVLNAL